MKKSIVLYFKIIILFSFLIFWVGYIGPVCISGDTDVIFYYLFFSVIAIPFLYQLGIEVFKDLSFYFKKGEKWKKYF